MNHESLSTDPYSRQGVTITGHTRHHTSDVDPASAIYIEGDTFGTFGHILPNRLIRHHFYKAIYISLV